MNVHYVRIGKFPFNWDPQRVGTIILSVSDILGDRCFHSIGIPSEWGRFYYP